MCRSTSGVRNCGAGRLRRARDLRARLSQPLSARSTALEADLLHALELSPLPAAIVEASGRILCLSRAARRLLEDVEGVAEDLGCLVSDHARASAMLRVALRHASERRELAAAADPAPHEVELPRLSGRHVRLTLQPLGSSGRLLVTFDSAIERIELDPARVEAAFGLTPTEAQLSIALASGLTVSRFAAERGCSEHTARTHLKRVLDKTGCGRQVELVRRLLTTPGLRLQ